MDHSLWQRCLSVLQEELPAQQFSMWIRPLQCVVEDNIMTLYAPNRFVLDWVRDKYVERITTIVSLAETSNPPLLRFDVGTKPVQQAPVSTQASKVDLNNGNGLAETPAKEPETNLPKTTNVRNKYTFDNFVEGKSNQLARAAASQ
ncbi:chromosomal replication initiator protein DnaA, partial [Thalassotalea euphylliae]